jgi:pimeloyl-ACP methyl ester carboxylesterase
MPSIQSRDGTVISYRRAGTGPPLLLVHGTSAIARRWGPMLRTLAADFTIYEMDRRGYGESGDAATYAIEDEFDDIAACLAAVADGPADVVAHSYGALCALEAARRSAQVRRLVLHEPPIAIDPEAYCRPGLVAAMRARIARRDNDGAVTVFATEVLQIPPDELAVMKRLAMWSDVVNGAPVVLRELESAARYKLRPEDFQRWSIPTLLLLGGESPSQYRETAKTLGAALPGSSIRVLPGQHHLGIKMAPALFARAIRDFLT